ncbi:MAG: FKBP-type peptidyl-prolyl cis-trans isomerase SlyD [Elusimicrobia bacterium]|nr:MAG: FKBP-type peptidyl-prolyl cis-trans isomerase SlyD [Elusimicrobiota bacterium]
MAARRALIHFAVLGAALACGGREPRVAEGSKVKLTYTVKADGKPYHGTEAPLTLRIGTGDLLPAIEARLKGRRAGEVVDMTLAPTEGFGPRDPKKVASIPLDRFSPESKGLRVGDKVGGIVGSLAAQGVVVEVSSDAAVLDFNAPLAGKTLEIRVTLLEVLPPQ